MMRHLLHVASSQLELEVIADDDGLHARVRQVFRGTSREVGLAPVVLQGDVPWTKLREGDRPNDDSAQAHEGASRDRDAEL